MNALRIPIGYWAVDLLDYEPYVSGQVSTPLLVPSLDSALITYQFPYLIQAVTWAQELGLTVLIDLHGAPGSQNGQDNSGLIGPVMFAANATNAERSLGVLRNLTEEFAGGAYDGTVTGESGFDQGVPRCGRKSRDGVQAEGKRRA